MQFDVDDTSRMQHSLRVCSRAYSELVPKLGNRDGCGGKVVRHKSTLGCTAVGWAYSHSHLCGCCRASGLTVRGVSMRGPVINQGPHHIQI